MRKGLEAYFTMLIETLWPKQRILEVYLNIAEFGRGIYGVGAAAGVYFHKPAARLSVYDAALLAAVLPNPNACASMRRRTMLHSSGSWARCAVSGGTALLKEL